MDQQTPYYLYDASIIDQRINELKTHIAEPIGNTEFLYAIKANFNPHIVRHIVEQGIGIDAVSVEEVRLAMHCGVNIENIMYTENNISDTEMHQAQELGVLINFNSLSRLETYGQNYPGSDVCVRFNPTVGDGLHEKVITGGPTSKFGIDFEQLDEVLSICTKHQLNIVGIHHHVGSGWLNTAAPLTALNLLLEIAQTIPNLQFVDVGGGFGVPYRPTDTRLNLQTLGQAIANRMNQFRSEYGSDVQLRFEPGRYIVAESGSLITQVTAIKTNTSGRTFVGTNTGMHHLIRPALYDSYHPIQNTSNPNGEMRTYDICGNICECSDFFAKDREMSEINIGDILSIDVAGAYGMCMSSDYQFRSKPVEVLRKNGKDTIIFQPQSFEQRLAQYN
jgi:diaminopimelate decarboxylase